MLQTYRRLVPFLHLERVLGLSWCVQEDFHYSLSSIDFGMCSESGSLEEALARGECSIV